MKNPLSLTLTCDDQGFLATYNSESIRIQQPWELPDNVMHLQTLVVDGVLQCLTSMEADLAMLNWIKTISIGGQIKVCVPNTDYYIKLWQQADWTNADLINADSLARKAFAGLWGAQFNSNPRDANYQPNDTSVHKSGYNSSRLQLLLERAGFCYIEIKEKQESLVATGRKSMDPSERQISTKYDQIRPDHLNRYEFACSILGRLTANQRVLDLACGIGYGTLMLAERTVASVTGVDIDHAAIAHAEKYFSAHNTHFLCQDARNIDTEEKLFNAIVSFETIEHVSFDTELMESFYALLTRGGTLICSTPNQDIMPFDSQKFPFHVKHYTVSEFKELLKSAGFSVESTYQQVDPKGGKVEPGECGAFTIIVAKKP